MLRIGLLASLSYAACPEAGADTPLTTARVASGLSQPLYVTHAPEDVDRVFIVEQGGRIKILRNGALLPTPFLNISSLVSSGGERGLLGLAFHPNYADTGYFYVNYTDSSGHSVVARFQVSDDPDLANAGSAWLVMRISQPQSNHNGGWMDFGPDGLLYIATGDGGGQFDTGAGHTIETGNAQDTTANLLGKILRIDVDSDDFPGDSQRNYAIPDDNPFVGTEGDHEIWSYGLRNPWRCAFDRETGDLFIADVGQDDWEEINVQPAGSPGGQNYGWRCMEGSSCTGMAGCTCFDPALTAPIHEYSHGGSPFRCSVSGGEVYRGDAIPDLRGTYFFADFCSNQIWSLRYEGSTAADLRDRTSELAPGGGWNLLNVASFGRDAAGELYVCDLSGGEVFKIVADGSVQPAFIVDSDPPDGAIDARQPYEPDGSAPNGLGAVELSFNGYVADAVPDAFTLSQTGGDPPAPHIETVERLGDRRVRLVLSAPITPAAWTTVTHSASGTTTTLGRLPGDVDGNGLSEIGDLERLVDVLLGASPSQPIWSVDMDHSGALAPGDVLRLIDLLSGADSYDAYGGVTLP